MGGGGGGGGEVGSVWGGGGGGEEASLAPPSLDETLDVVGGYTSDCIVLFTSAVQTENNCSIEVHRKAVVGHLLYKHSNDSWTTEVKSTIGQLKNTYEY